MIKTLLVLCILLFAQTTYADCLAVADSAFPKGNWGQLNREGILRGYMCDSQDIRNIEHSISQMESKLNARVSQFNESLRFSNQASALVDQHLNVLRGWSDVSLNSNRNAESARRYLVASFLMKMKVKSMLSQVDVLLKVVTERFESGNAPDLKATYEALKKWSEILTILQNNLRQIKVDRK